MWINRLCRKSQIGLLGATLLIASCNSALAGDKNTTLQQQVTQAAVMDLNALAQRVHKEIESGITYRLDLANPFHYQYIVKTLKFSDHAKASSSSTTALIEKLQQAHEKKLSMLEINGKAPHSATAVLPNEDDRLQDLNFISRVTRSENTTHVVDDILFEATGLSSVVGGTDQTTITMNLYDATTGQVIDGGSAQEKGDGKDFRYTYGKVLANNTNVESIGMFVYFPTNSTDPNPIIEIQESSSYLAPADSCVEEPNYCLKNAGGQCSGEGHTKECINKIADKRKPVKLCWKRSSAEECDYWANLDKPDNYVFPLKGHATFDQTIASPLFGTTTIYMQSTLNGGGCFVHFEKGALLDDRYWSIDANNNVKFAYPEAAFNRSAGCLTNNRNAAVNLWVSTQVLLNGGIGETPKYANFSFTSDTQEIGKPGVEIIPQLYIMEGCLAAGTLITLKDDVVKKVEDVKKGDRIKTQDGYREVTGTSTGSELDNSLILISTQSGAKVEVTLTHPMVLANGLKVPANKVKIGDMLMGLEGPTEVKSVTYTKPAAKVFNLFVQSENGVGTYYAGGLLTGDANMQQELAALNERRPLRDDNTSARK